MNFWRVLKLFLYIGYIYLGLLLEILSFVGERVVVVVVFVVRLGWFFFFFSG